ncbi:MAG: ribosome recycling factor [Tenericutes bacterium]|nr:ribosome recycling factor [Mycoplasmatota bacterium]
MDEREIKSKMCKVINNLENRYTTIRAGRANPNILHGIMVDYYGTPTPLQSLANIAIPEARVLSIKPFDKSVLKNIEKAIYEANLGMAPTNNGEIIILTIPELTGETRKEYVKQASAMAEEAKIALRNIRQDENNKIKKNDIPEDERDLYLEIVQDLIDEYNKVVDEKYKEKELELTSI